MKKTKILDCLDGFFAYDAGSIDSGIKDDVLREKVFNIIKELQEEESCEYPNILKEYVKAYLFDDAYSLEDIKEFINWIDDNLY